MKFNKYHEGELSDKKFLVTGGAGFIGSNIVEYLMQFGAKKVRVLDNFETGHIENLTPFLNQSNFELIEGDIRDPAICQKALEDINFVSHQAALGSVPRSINDPIATNATNISGFLNMLVAAKDAKIKHFVYAASSSTYGDHPTLPKVEHEIGNPLSPYAVTKYVNELYASVFSKIYGMHTIGFRYFNVFGPRQDPKGPYAAVIPIFVDCALNNKQAYINGDGLTSRDFTFVANAVQANVKGMLSVTPEKNEIVNIAYGQRTTLNELWEGIAEMAKSSARPEYREERLGDVKHSLASIDRASQLLDYQPEYSVKEGLDITVKWYKENAKNMPY